MKRNNKPKQSTRSAGRKLRELRHEELGLVSGGGVGTSPQGVGTSPQGFGTSPLGFGTSPLGTSDDG